MSLTIEAPITYEALCNWVWDIKVISDTNYQAHLHLGTVFLFAYANMEIIHSSVANAYLVSKS